MTSNDPQIVIVESSSINYVTLVIVSLIFLFLFIKIFIKSYLYKKFKEGLAEVNA